MREIRWTLRPSNHGLTTVATLGVLEVMNRFVISVRDIIAE